MADAAAVRSARMQLHSRGRSKGDEAPRNRLEKATEKGLGCAEIQRPRQAMDAGAPVGAVWQTQRRHLARECNGIPEAAVRGMEARGRSTAWGRRRAVEAAKWRRSSGEWMDAEARRRTAETQRGGGNQEAAMLGMRR